MDERQAAPSGRGRTVKRDRSCRRRRHAAPLAGLLVGVGLWFADAGGAQPPTAPRMSDETRDALVAASQRESAARDARLDGPDAKRRRATSRQAFRGLGHAEALGLARSTFPELLDPPLLDGETPAPGMRVIRRIDESRALVRDDATGERVLVQSTVPLVGETAAGATAPLDLALLESPDGFAPKAAVRRTRVLTRGRPGIALEDAGVTLRLSGRPDPSVGVRNGRVFFSETQPDTDAFVTPQPAGAELFLQLRSPASPERFVIDVDLPPGAEMRRAASKNPIPGDPPRSIEIVRDGHAIAYVYPPLAYDADERVVETEMHIEDGALVLRVEHQQADLRYPLVVDPEAIQQSYCGGDWVTYCTGRWPGWRFGTSTGNHTPGYNYFGAAVNDPVYSPGLYASLPYNTTYSGPGAYGQWSFQAPDGTWMYRIMYGNSSHQPYGSTAIQGMMTPNYSWLPETRLVNNEGGVAVNPLVYSGPFAGRNHDFQWFPSRNVEAWDERGLAVMIIQPSFAGLDTGGNRANVAMGYANVYIGDGYWPKVEGGPPNRGWYNDNGQSRSATIPLSDRGTGLRSVTISGTASGDVAKYSGCTGDMGWSPCLGWWDAPVTYSLREGVNHLSATGRDAVDNPTWNSHHWTEHVDRTRPDVVLDGNVWDDRARSVGLAEPRLVVDASDRISAVASVDVRASGDTASRSPISQSGNVRTYSFSDLPDGIHTISVTVKDLAGNPWSDDWDVLIDRHAPRILRTTHVSRPTGWTSDGSGSVTVEADDLATGQPDYGTGVRYLRLLKEDASWRYKYWSCGGTISSRCLRNPGSYTFTYSAASRTQFPQDGVFTITAAAEDGLRVGKGASWDVKIDRTGPSITPGGTLLEADEQVISGGSYTVDPEATDAGPEGALTSGIKRMTVAVDGETVYDDDKVASCSDSCPRTAKLAQAWVYRTADYGDGTHIVEVEVTDWAGNLSVFDTTFEVAHAEALPSQTLDLDASRLTRLDGGSAGDLAGRSVANVGDINRDGHEDILVGAPGDDPSSRIDAGSAWLVLGNGDPVDRILQYGEPRVVRIAGAKAGDAAGTAVAPAGDVNGDGYLDLLVGAPGSVSEDVLQGTVYVIFGGASFAGVDLGNLGSRGIVINGPAVTVSGGELIPPPPTTFGSQLAQRRVGDYETDGDVNGDDLDDIVIGASNQSGAAVKPRPDSGTTYVVFGQAASGVIDATTLGTKGYRIHGAAPLDRSGQSTALVGDVNADDRADVAITAPNVEMTSDRSDAGAAYLVFGKSTTGDVDLSTLGAGGFRVYGASGDAILNAGAVGDVDGDSNPDLMLGGHGAQVVFLQPDRGDIDMAAVFTGYRLVPPTGTGFDGAVVSGAGDVDGDGAADTLVAFPAAGAGSGSSFLVLGRLDRTSVNLAALGGHRGTRLNGGPGEAAGSSVGAYDSSADESPAVVTGSPEGGSRGARAGTVYATSSQATASRTKMYKGCQASSLWTFPYLGATGNDRLLPRCRRAKWGTVDSPAKNYRTKSKFNPKPLCGDRGPTRTCRPSALGGGNARMPVSNLAVPGDVKLKDSFGTVIGYIDQVPRTAPGSTDVKDDQCFEVSDAAGTPRGRTCDTEFAGNDARLEVVGKACMKDDVLEDAHFLIRLLPVEPDPAIDNSRLVKFNEYGGFVERGALPFTRGGTRWTRAERAYAGCGQRPSKRIKRPTEATPLPADRNRLFIRDDKYMSNNSEPRSDCRLNPIAPCAGSLQNYQLPEFDVPRVAEITISTTAVSYRGYRQGRNPKGGKGSGGGLVRALVPRGAASLFEEYDTMTYSDPNVPCGATPKARWVYGAANPKGEPDHLMFGWALKRVEMTDLKREC